MITFGTNPGMGIPVRGIVPRSASGRAPGLEKALRYMGLEPGKPLLGRKIDVVFIGSCTNSRITDLREAATVLRGRRVAAGVRDARGARLAGGEAQAEAEGLDRVFREAGAEWREPGCSMCIAMNGDQLEPGQYAVSTSNRNFEGRQGKGGRTFLACPLPRPPRRYAARSPTRARCCDAWTARSPTIDQRAPWSLPIDNVDTDQIIPARFLKMTDEDGLGELLFADWRFDADGTPKRGLRAEPARGRGRARSCVAGQQLRLRLARASTRRGRCSTFGFRAVVSTRFADIFRDNALKNGLLPVQVDEVTPGRRSSPRPARRSMIDVAAGTSRCPTAARFGSRSTPFSRTAAERRRRARRSCSTRQAEIAAYEAASGLRAPSEERHERRRSSFLPGDGIGPEVTRAAARARGRAMPGTRPREALVGGSAIDATGEPLPDETLALCQGATAVFLGAVGGPKWDDRARCGRSRACSRCGRRSSSSRTCGPPATWAWPDAAQGEPACAGVDLLFVRELTGGVYFGEPRCENARDEAVDTWR